MINLIKLCVGVDSVEELEAWRAERRENGFGQPGAPGNALVAVIANGPGHLEVEVVGFNPHHGKLFSEVSLENAELDGRAVVQRPWRRYQGHSQRVVSGLHASSYHSFFLTVQSPIG